VDRREVYLLGEMSSEVWINSGGVPFPFTRIPGTSTQQGIAAQFSMARMGNSFAYVSKNNRGEAMIVRMNGYFPERISTHAVETTLVNQNVSDALAWTYQLEGHEVYVVTFPSVGENGLTWAYDNTTGCGTSGSTATLRTSLSATVATAARSLTSKFWLGITRTARFTRSRKQVLHR
jgi:hypothetical protein